MKFASFQHNGFRSWGVVDGDDIRDCRTIAPALQSALEAGTLPREAAAAARLPPIPLSEVTLLAPVPDTGRIFCIGLNYIAHREETGRRPTDQPVIFVRFAASVVGHGQALLLPCESDKFDFEGELGVVIGKPGRRIPEIRALDHVAGYSCFMDGSLRDFQMHTHQYTPGKNFDNSGAFGPFLVSAPDVGDPNAGLKLETRLNGAVMQSATTDQMIFPVPVLINYISSFTQLMAGDVIATGTPGGVGFKRNPPVFMKPGDIVEVEIDKVGLLRNTVQAE